MKALSIVDNRWFSFRFRGRFVHKSLLAFMHVL